MRLISLESLRKPSLASSSQYTLVFLCSYYRFPSSVKATKPGKSDATPAKGSLTSGKQNVFPIDTQPQTEVDLV